MSDGPSDLQLATDVLVFRVEELLSCPHWDLVDNLESVRGAVEVYRKCQTEGRASHETE